MSKKTVLVAGAGGFIGSHLVKRLVADGHYVVGTDIKPVFEWHQLCACNNISSIDLRDEHKLRGKFPPFDVIYNLAADMGGIGFIEKHRADCMLNVLINTNLLALARQDNVQRYFFASSACVYAADRQKVYSEHALTEDEAYPAMPEDGYGWEKLFSERMCEAFLKDYNVETRVARFHNVYGPCGTYFGGREKAPAAICRKVVEAELSGSRTIDIWGDGEQWRSFTYIDDCVEGILRITAGDSPKPVNLGSSEVVTVNQLVSLVEEVAGLELRRNYVPTAAQGVRWRNSDNTLCKKLYGWEPTTKLRDGIEKTYRWVRDQMTGGTK
jgi:GDP-D-mannose 3',5'-epimerase